MISDLQIEIIIKQELLGLPRGPGISLVYELAIEIQLRRAKECARLGEFYRNG